MISFQLLIHCILIGRGPLLQIVSGAKGCIRIESQLLFPFRIRTFGCRILHVADNSSDLIMNSPQIIKRMVKIIMEMGTKENRLFIISHKNLSKNV